MKLDALIAAAKEYRALQDLQAQIKELSRPSLARKFEYTNRKIAMAEDGYRHDDVSEEDFALIRQCQQEHIRLIGVRNGNTRAKIAKKYAISNEAVTHCLEFI